MPLSVKQLNAAEAREREYKLYDANGLYILVKPTGRKFWRFKYRFAGKERKLALGEYPKIGLKDAREKAERHKVELRDGIDPSAIKRMRKAESKKQARIAENSFRSVALDWFKVTKQKWRSKHSERVEKILYNELFPHFGHKPISEVTAPDLLYVIRLIESREAYETAKKTRRVAGQVFRYGIAIGLCEYDHSSALKDAMTVVKTRHMAAVTEPDELAHILRLIDGYTGTPQVKNALRITPLLFQRPTEIRHLEWSEIDWERSLAVIDGSKMKMGADHIIPLARQSVEILRDQQQHSADSKYVFPTPKTSLRPLSENAVRAALRTLGIDNETQTPHGFRATARTILDEVLGFRVDIIEQQLAHAVKDATGRAYNRTKYLPQRAEMMQKWADFLDDIKSKGGN